MEDIYSATPMSSSNAASNDPPGSGPASSEPSPSSSPIPKSTVEPGELEDSSGAGGSDDDTDPEVVVLAYENPDALRSLPADNRVFVGKLSEDTTEADLTRAFSTFGNVVDVSIPRIPDTEKSRGFAYLTFSDAAAAELVLASTEKFRLRGRVVEVQRPKRKPRADVDPPAAAGGGGGGGSRQQRKRRQRLNRTSSTSPTLSPHDGPDPTPHFAPFAATPTFSGGGNFGVRKRRKTATPPASMPSRFNGVDNRKLFIGGISPSTNSQSLREYFSQWGTVLDAVAMKCNRKPRGFGFVTFEDANMLDACQADRPHFMGGHPVDTRRAIPKDDMEQCEGDLVTERLFVGELQVSVEEKDLMDYFSIFGRVQNVDLIRDKHSGRKRGFAYVQFDDYDVVDKIVCSGPHQIRGRRCNVEKAVDPETHARRKQQAKTVPAPWVTGDRPWSVTDFPPAPFGPAGHFQQQQNVWPHMPSLAAILEHHGYMQTPLESGVASNDALQHQWTNYLPIGGALADPRMSFGQGLATYPTEERRDPWSSGPFGQMTSNQGLILNHPPARMPSFQSTQSNWNPGESCFSPRKAGRASSMNAYALGLSYGMTPQAPLGQPERSALGYPSQTYVPASSSPEPDVRYQTSREDDNVGAAERPEEVRNDWIHSEKPNDEEEGNQFHNQK